MKKERVKFNVTVSLSIYEILQKTKKGTNLTNSDVIELVIQQYFGTATAKAGSNG